MQFIELTLDHVGNRRPIHVNPDRIGYFYRYELPPEGTIPGIAHTLVHIEGAQITVKETPEEILALINGAVNDA